MQDLLVAGLAEDKPIFDKLEFFNTINQLGLNLHWQSLTKTNQKTLLTLAGTIPYLLVIIKKTPMLVYLQEDEIIKIHPNWQSLTKRIVSAGRKSELLLQAAKLSPQAQVIDATAGFGHDGLLLASTGATLTLIEQNPIVALLLFYEYWQMNLQPNWQKLLARIELVFGESSVQLTKFSGVDMVYLDPMFPQDSYQAKVGKRMQVLHQLVRPPSINQEKNLLKTACCAIHAQAKVLVKRPVHAKHLADCLPIQSFTNEAVRFDMYQQITL